jgi:hypothetical protein
MLEGLEAAREVVALTPSLAPTVLLLLMEYDDDADECREEAYSLRAYSLRSSQSVSVVSVAYDVVAPCNEPSRSISVPATDSSIASCMSPERSLCP